jgi:uncharacterized protein (DUF1810 family)
LASGGFGSAETLKLLISWGVDINLRDYKCGKTALHDLALFYQGSENIIETLLSFDPEIYEDSEGRTAAYYERDRWNRDVLIAEYLAERFRRTGKDALPYIPPSKSLKHSNDVYKDWEKKAGSLDRFLEAHEDGQYDRLYNDLLYGDDLTSCLHIFFPLARDRFKQNAKTFRYYGLSGLDEAREYLSHRILGKRLCDLVKVLIDRNVLTRKNVLYQSEQDHMQKFLTLFALADKDGEKGLFSSLMKTSGVSFHKKTEKILGFF